MLRGARRACPSVGPVALSCCTGIPTLVKAPVEDVFGDPVFENFDRASGDHPATGAAHAIFRKRVLTVAKPAHNLDCLIGDFEACLVTGQLCKCRLVW